MVGLAAEDAVFFEETHPRKRELDFRSSPDRAGCPGGSPGKAVAGQEASLIGRRYPGGLP